MGIRELANLNRCREILVVFGVFGLMMLIGSFSELRMEILKYFSADHITETSNKQGFRGRIPSAQHFAKIPVSN